MSLCALNLLPILPVAKLSLSAGSVNLCGCRHLPTLGVVVIVDHRVASFTGDVWSFGEQNLLW